MSRELTGAVNNYIRFRCHPSMLERQIRAGKKMAS